MKKIFFIVFFSVFCIYGFFFLSESFFKNDQPTLPVRNLRVCPDAWVENSMPIIGQNDKTDSYFIVENQRFEYDALDIDWVRQNCSVKTPIKVF